MPSAPAERRPIPIKPRSAVVRRLLHRAVLVAALLGVFAVSFGGSFTCETKTNGDENDFNDRGRSR